MYGAATPAPFDLLSTRLGHDCAGSVQFCRAGETSQLLALESGTRRLTAAEFADLIDEVSALFHRHAATPAAEFRALLAHLAFRWLVRDADGHSKNVTLQLTASDVRCSPLYDVWSLAAMNPAAETDMALAMWATGTGRLTEAEEDGYWEHTSRALGLRPRVGLAVVEDIVARFPEAVRAAVSDLPDHPTVQETAENFLRLADERDAKRALG